MYVETDVAYADHVALCGLYGETGIDEENSRLTFFVCGESMTPNGECGERPLHGASGRDAAERVDVYTDKCFHEFRCRILYSRYSSVGRIDGGAAVGQGFLFGLQCYV